MLRVRTKRAQPPIQTTPLDARRNREVGFPAHARRALQFACPEPPLARLIGSDRVGQRTDTSNASWSLARLLLVS